jgi:putative hydrolase of the HAD superfamily
MSQNQLNDIRAVIFDVGNTLTTPDWERIHAVSRKFIDAPFDAEDLQKRIAEILFKADNDEIFLKNLAGKSVRTSWHLLKLYEDLGLNESQLEEMAAALDKLHLERHLWTRLNKDALDVFNQLKKRNLRIGVISNSEDGQVENLLKAIEFIPLLDVYFDSYVIGLTKPDPEIFLKAVKELGAEPEEAVYIGDSYRQDIIGAQSAGLKAVLFDPLNLHPERDVIKIRSLKELLLLLAEPIGRHD